MQKYFLYKIHIHFPIDIKQLIITTQSLKDQNNLFELIFDIASLDDYLKAWEIIEEYQIDKYQFNPIYTGYNIDFFKDNAKWRCAFEYKLSSIRQHMYS